MPRQLGQFRIEVSVLFRSFFKPAANKNRNFICFESKILIDTFYWFIVVVAITSPHPSLIKRLSLLYTANNNANQFRSITFWSQMMKMRTRSIHICWLFPNFWHNNNDLFLANKKRSIDIICRVTHKVNHII